MADSICINTESPYCIEQFCDALKQQMQAANKTYDEICVACIGTDRATGDCLGPLVGHKLSGFDKAKITGTLDSPLHAKNIGEFIESISENQLVIAVDASLGKYESIGYINIKKGPISPGSGVNKNLQPIGDISITGVVNMGGFQELMILQNTRLSIVMKLADIIADGLRMVL